MDNAISMSIYGAMFVITMWVFIMFSTHRYSINSLEFVKDGHVMSTTRCKPCVDKKTKLEYYKPMFGGKWLPKPNFEAFQKVSSIPLIGIQREITILYPSKNNPVVMMPNGQGQTFDIKRWLFLKERALFLKKIRRDNLMNFLTIYAPITIIVGTFLFFGLLIVGEMKNNALVVSRFEELTNILMNLFEKQ